MTLTPTHLLLRSIQLAPEQGHEKYMYLGQLREGKDALQCYQKGVELMHAVAAVERVRSRPPVEPYAP